MSAESRKYALVKTGSGYLEKAERIKSDNPQIYVNRGNVYLLQMKYDEAVQEYRKAVEIDEFNARFHVNLAICFYEKTEFDSAIKEYERAVELDDSIKDAYKYLAETRKQETVENKASDVGGKSFPILWE